MMKWIYFTRSERAGLIGLYGLLIIGFLVNGKKQEAFSNSINRPLIDINNWKEIHYADRRDLDLKLVERISKYGKMLGGFHTEEQLLEVYGMDSSSYYQIKDKLYLDTLVLKKINLIRIDFKSLLKHPYFDYALTKAVFKERKKCLQEGKPFDFKGLDLVNEELYCKIAPYLAYEYVE